MSNPSSWLSQPYHTDFFTVGQTESTPPTAAAPGASRNGFSLSPDRGRVAKPARRRSRASRRTPTTLFNTDTANFRAMVQRFTGGPSAAYAAEPQLPSGGGLNFIEHMTSGGGRPAALGIGSQYPSQEMMFLLGGGGGPAPAPAPEPENVDRSYENYFS
ncbi:VQ motif-containing protein [Striga hermonthica]|uniref:VQ motif-containing protein n=1 Tax=Striga hermonthica TaxID=68872 RepID=A0A9N7R372_STRHE|nr:VQ motif-containing protein [Striga hermonthica]